MAFSAPEQATAAAKVRPLFWARLAVNHTKKTFCLSLVPPVVCLIIILVAGALSLDTPHNMDYAIRNDIRTRLDDARTSAQEAFRYVAPGADDDGSVAERTETDPELTTSILFRGRVGSGGEVGVLDETEDQASNVLTLDGILLMKKAEDLVTNDSNYKNFCFHDPQARDCDDQVPTCVLPQSMLNSEFLYGNYTAEGKLCGRRNEPPNQDDFKQFMDSLFTITGSGTKEVNATYARYLGLDFTPDNPESWIAKSVFEMGEPFTGFKSPEDRETDQEDKFKDWATEIDDRVEALSTPTIDVALIGFTLIDASFSSIAFRDLSFSIAAIALVVLIIWFHTTSLVLAGTALIQIILCFPYAFFVYHFVFQQKYFASLQLLVIFLVLGIGADDVFVFTDAWKQSAVVLGSDCDLVIRMSWTYKRAVVAMSVTSFTTAIAFFLTATSPIMPIGTLGFWAGLLILLQYLLVITVYPCSIIFWHRFWRVRSIRNCFKEPDPNAEKRPPLWHRCVPKKWRPELKEENADEYRVLERFFRGPWINFIRRFRFVLLALGTILVGVSIYLATQLEPPKEEEQFLPKSHKLQRSITSLQDAFPRSDVELQLQVKISWGIKDIDRTGTSKFTPDIPGKPILDNSFDMTKKATQERILKACSFFGGQQDLIFQGDAIEATDCWIKDFLSWRTDVEGKEEFQDYARGQDLVEDLERFANYTNDDGIEPYRQYLDDEYFLFNKGHTRVVFAEIGFVSPTETSVPYKIMRPVYDKWQSELSKFNAASPEGANQAVATGDYPWVWQITQQKLVSSMFQNIGIMLAVAFFTLFLSSMNWALAIISTITIGGIVANLLGFIELVGWQLGITETVAVVISVGYSFDGAAHLATAYNESNSEDRFNRTRDALTDLGISILFGAITTLLAGVMLFPAIIVFFVKFGALLVATVTLSMIWTLTFFPALLVTFGPSGSFGSLKPYVKKLFKKRGQRPREEGEIPQRSSSPRGESSHEGREKVWDANNFVVPNEMSFETPYEFSPHIASPNRR